MSSHRPWSRSRRTELAACRPRGRRCSSPTPRRRRRAISSRSRIATRSVDPSCRRNVYSATSVPGAGSILRAGAAAATVRDDHAVRRAGLRARRSDRRPGSSTMKHGGRALRRIADPERDAVEGLRSHRWDASGLDHLETGVADARTRSIGSYPAADGTMGTPHPLAFATGGAARPRRRERRARAGTIRCCAPAARNPSTRSRSFRLEQQ